MKPLKYFFLLLALALPVAAQARVTVSWYDRAEGRAASWVYPVGTRLRLSHGRRVVYVLCDDRGPNRRLLGTRQLDVSPDVFVKLGGNLGDGLMSGVRVRVIRKAGGTK